MNTVVDQVIGPFEVDNWFRLLEVALRSTPLPCVSGNRTAQTDEFMFMGINGCGQGMFKHRNTRDYVYLGRGGPLTIQPTSTFDY